MLRIYTSRYGKLVKNCPGLVEYWYQGKLVARGSSLSSPDPRSKPNSEDWQYCFNMTKEKA